MALTFKKDIQLYSLPFRVTNEVKLSVFQYKIVYNILYTNIILYKMKKKRQPESSIAKLFWNKFTNWYNAICAGNIALEKNEMS